MGISLLLALAVIANMGEFENVAETTAKFP
jgi:hypothetical protein